MDGGDTVMKSDLTYFCVGTAVGVAAAMLFTPKSGRRTRAYLNSKATKGVESIKTSAEEVRTAAVDAVEKGKQAVKKQSDAVAAAFDAGKQAYEEAVATTPFS
jgi:gas vesicle protein